MTARRSIEYDFTNMAPHADADSWPSRQPPSLAAANAHAALEAQATKTAEWLSTQHFDGIIPPAEKIVLDCLRALKAVPEADSFGADQLMRAVAEGFLNTAYGPQALRRRAHALLRIAGELS